ncbi:MAG: tRNA pseudouridine(38-40) synthase TruA [Coriobacteriales bacterium]|jgi:tRNA pseudouridine38-40 synthase
MSDSGILNTIVILVAYIGAPFCGFARQEGLLTVQGELENALATVFAHEVETVCAGRTDAGVHARGQVVSAVIPKSDLENRTLESVARSLNALTHDCIVVRDVAIAPDGFSARFDADWREYRYRIAVGKDFPMFTRDFTWHIKSSRSLDIEKMREASEALLGEHDFKSFCVTASAVGKNTVREILELEIYEEEVMGEPGIVFRVVGNAFLHSMVRTIVGTLVEVGAGRREPSWVADVLEARDRSAAGPKAPANGLVFWHVEYKDLPNLGEGNHGER